MTRLEACFIANATVLCTHQIDAAFWHEWEMFHLPGGNQLNLVLNLPIIASVFVAFWHVVARSGHARRAHVYLVFLGFLTLSLHSMFFGLGYLQFSQPASLALLFATGVLSTLQLIWTLAKTNTPVGTPTA